MCIIHYSVIELRDGLFQILSGTDAIQPSRTKQVITTLAASSSIFLIPLVELPGLDHVQADSLMPGVSVTAGDWLGQFQVHGACVAPNCEETTPNPERNDMW